MSRTRGHPGTQATVTKLVGAPGSGKTTELLRFTEREADVHDTPASDLLFTTFTRSARADAADRLGDIYPGVDEDDLDKRVRTLHGAALAACLAEDVLELRNRNDLDADGQLLIRRTNDDHAGYFAWFFRTQFPHIEYDTEERDPIQQLQNGECLDASRGNQVMVLYDYLQSADWPLDHHHHAPVDVDLPSPEILDVLESWEAFKDRHDLIEDADYVHAALEAHVSPPARVLFVDEFQDLSPLLYRLYELWRDSSATDRVYIAGDPHQAIYGFRAANPALFRVTPADNIIRREESRRCPQAIIDAAVPIVNTVPDHDVSNVTAMRDGGRVDHVEIPDSATLGRLVRTCHAEYGQVYLLVRTNRQAAKLAYGLRDAGVPYRDLNPNGPLQRWRDPAPFLLEALRAFGEERGWPLLIAERFLQNVTDARARRDAMERADPNNEGRLTATDTRFGHQILPREYRDWFPDATDAHDLVAHLSVDDWQRDLVAGALASGATNDPEDVRIGTIHAAKGRETPCVLVFPAYTHRQLDRFHDGDEAAERRLYYVALTRSSQTIHVVHEYFGGETFPPLERGGRIEGVPP